jgi:hypothetical protein
VSVLKGADITNLKRATLTTLNGSFTALQELNLAHLGLIVVYLWTLSADLTIGL